MKKAYCIVMSLALIVTAATFETGCKSGTSAAQVISIIESQLPTDLTQAATIAGLSDNASLTQFFQQAATIAGTDLPIIQNLVQTYKANQTSGNLAAIAAACSQLATQLNQQVLAANHVASSSADKIAIAVLSAFALGINGWSLALASSGAKTAQLTPPGFYDVLAIAPYDKAVEVAAVYGVTPGMFFR